ncbi:chemotaxis protein CheE [Caulobacter sp. DWR2-3-1b2]|uniref:chemotaxis protein CheE n=1 Tax=Caulobacter sp. DWR2-3-1b2 TaxID=2804642 RepID=UPI003CE9B485
MSVVRKFRAPNRLSMLIKAAGGPMAQDALKAAETALEPLRAESMAVLDAALAEIDARYGKPAAATRAGETFQDLYVLALRIIDVSGFLPGSCVDQAALSFCALVDNCIEANAWRWDAIDVHINALRLLRTAGLTADQRQAVIAGLNKVSQHRLDDAN